jgi:hypothetical protein
MRSVIFWQGFEEGKIGWLLLCQVSVLLDLFMTVDGLLTVDPLVK